MCVCSYLRYFLKQFVTYSWDKTLILVIHSCTHHSIRLTRACSRDKGVKSLFNNYYTTHTCLPICKDTGIIAIECIVQYAIAQSIKHYFLTWGRQPHISTTFCWPNSLLTCKLRVVSIYRPEAMIESKCLYNHMIKHKAKVYTALP